MLPPSAQPAGAAVGDRLADRYLLLERLGAGGMGVVFRCRDESLDEDVAIKLLLERHTKDAEYRSRLRQEVRLARRVSHPNVCRVHDIGVDRDRLFVSMELIPGRSLRGYLREVRSGQTTGCTLAQAVDILAQLLAGLGAAHRAGVIHRDVKPDNVIIDADRAVLTDFGVARHGATGGDGTTVIAGTPAYIAPELLRGEAYDHRADVYSAAVLAYELICGQHPFGIEDLAAAAAHARSSAPPPPVPDEFGDLAVGEALTAVFSAALSLSPDARPPSPEALAEQLARAVRAGDPATADAPVALARRLTPQHLEETLIGSAAPLTPPDATIAPASAEGNRAEATRVAIVLAFASGRQRSATAHDEVAVGSLRPATLSAAAERLERAILELDGTPLEVGDEGALAVFGVPRSAGDDAARAAQVARLLVEHTEGGRAAITCGRVTVENAAGLRLSGQAIASARALVAAAAPADIRIDAAAARQLAGRYEIIETAGSESASGNAHASSPALLVGGAHRVGAGLRPTPLRLDAQARLLEAARHCFASRTPTFVAVRAPAGFGKTRLRDAFVEELDERRDVAWLHAHGAQLGTAAPLSLLRSTDPAFFAAIAGAGFADRSATVAAARRFLETRAMVRPVVILIDDVQWADEVSLSLIDRLRRDLVEVPVLIVTLGRETTPPATGEELVALAPLSPGDAGNLVREFAPHLSDEGVDKVVARGDGNAFFLEELARDLTERESSDAASAIPASIEAVMQSRIDRLAEHEWAVLAVASVLGQDTPRGALRAVLASHGASLPVESHPRDERELDRALDALVSRGLLEVTTDDDAIDIYEVRPRMVQELVYASFADGLRERLHTGAADWFEEELRTKAESPLLLASLAHHRDAANDPRAAELAYRRAGILSLEFNAYADALASLSRALALAEAPDGELLEQLGDAQRSAETSVAALATYDRALALGPMPAMQQANLHEKRGACLCQIGDTQAAIAAYEVGLALVAPYGDLTAESEQDPVVASRLLGSLGWLLGYQLGLNDVGLPHSERAVRLLEGTPHRRDLARALSRLGANYMRAGRWREQLQCNRRNLDIGIELRDLSMQLTAHVNLGVVHGSLGDLSDAIAHTRRAIALAQQTSALTTLGLCQSNLAGLLLEVDSLEEARIALGRGLALAERCGTRQYLPEALGFRARLKLADGDPAEAAKAIDAAVAAATDAGFAIDRGIALRLRGSIRSLAGDTSAAIEDFDAAEALLQHADEYEHARTLAARARHLVAADLREFAAPLFARADEVFRKLGAARELELLADPCAVR